jgi:hypothetical protein
MLSVCEEKVTEELRLQSSGTFRVGKPNKGTEENGSSLAVCNRFGVAFVAVRDGFVWSKTHQLDKKGFESSHDKEQEQPFVAEGHTVLGSRPDVLALSFDETLLAVAIGNRVVVFAVNAPGHCIQEYSIGKLSGRCLSVEWAPNAQKLLILLDTGHLQLCEGGQVVATCADAPLLSATFTSTDVCVSSLDGTIHIMDSHLKSISTIAPPKAMGDEDVDDFFGHDDAQAHCVRWIDGGGGTEGVLFVGYRRLQDGETVTKALLRDVASGSWVLIDCLCPGVNEARPMGQQYKLDFIKAWGLLAVGSNCSQEVEIVAWSMLNNAWEKWELSEDFCARAPDREDGDGSDSGGDDYQTYPTGLQFCTDKTEKRPIPNEDRSLPPYEAAPTLYMSTNSGLVCAFHVFPTDPGAIGVCPASSVLKAPLPMIPATPMIPTAPKSLVVPTPVVPAPVIAQQQLDYRRQQQDYYQQQRQKQEQRQEQEQQKEEEQEQQEQEQQEEERVEESGGVLEQVIPPSAASNPLQGHACVYCPSGHSMNWSGLSSGTYVDGWWCDACKTASCKSDGTSSHPHRFNCSECDVDYCKNCSQRFTTKPQLPPAAAAAVPLRKAPLIPRLIDLFGGWRADKVTLAQKGYPREDLALTFASCHVEKKMWLRAHSNCSGNGTPVLRFEHEITPELELKIDATRLRSQVVLHETLCTRTNGLDVVGKVRTDPSSGKVARRYMLKFQQHEQWQEFWQHFRKCQGHMTLYHEAVEKQKLRKQQKLGSLQPLVGKLAVKSKKQATQAKQRPNTTVRGPPGFVVAQPGPFALQQEQFRQQCMATGYAWKRSGPPVC